MASAIMTPTLTMPDAHISNMMAPVNAPSTPIVCTVPSAIRSGMVALGNMRSLLWAFSLDAQRFWSNVTKVQSLGLGKGVPILDNGTKRKGGNGTYDFKAG